MESMTPVLLTVNCLLKDDLLWAWNEDSNLSMVIVRHPMSRLASFYYFLLSYHKAWANVCITVLHKKSILYMLQFSVCIVNFQHYCKVQKSRWVLAFRSSHSYRVPKVLPGRLRLRGLNRCPLRPNQICFILLQSLLYGSDLPLNSTNQNIQLIHSLLIKIYHTTIRSIVCEASCYLFGHLVI